MDWQFGGGLVDRSRIDIRLAMDWRWMGGLAMDDNRIGGLVMDWHRIGGLMMYFQIGLGLALNWWIVDGFGFGPSLL